MRHQKHKYKLSMDPAHRASVIRNLAIELIDHGKIKTTITRTKALRIYVEKLVTLAKKDTVHNRRLAFQKLHDTNAVSNLFNNIAPKFKERAGGYTRIIKVADGRIGDGAKLGFIEFVA